MVSLKVFNRVTEELRRIERDQDVRVLYACESGSRAWGFASGDSDYDVRFIYVHPPEWYLSIEDHRDVIEEPISDILDISGWELRKALKLLRKSNPPLLEWLKSPVVYVEEETFIGPFKELAADCYSPNRCYRHYLHMAMGNVREYLKGETVWLKKYLYVLRPLMACRWIERALGEVPMRFENLVDQTIEDAGIRLAIDRLLEMKKSGAELQRAPRIEVLSQFIALELPRLAQLDIGEDPSIDVGALNRFFRDVCQNSLEVV